MNALYLVFVLNDCTLAALINLDWEGSSLGKRLISLEVDSKTGSSTFKDWLINPSFPVIKASSPGSIGSLVLAELEVGKSSPSSKITLNPKGVTSMSQVPWPKKSNAEFSDFMIQFFGLSWEKRAEPEIIKYDPSTPISIALDRPSLTQFIRSPAVFLTSKKESGEVTKA